MPTATPKARRKWRRWMQEGSFKSREDIVQGLEKFPDALLMLFEGKNFGKLILQVAPE